MRESRNPPVKSEWTLAAERALMEARKMPPGRDRLAALKGAGKLRNEALTREMQAAGRSPDQTPRKAGD